MEGPNSPQWEQEGGHEGTTTHPTVGSAPMGTGCPIPHHGATRPSPRQTDSTASHRHSYALTDPGARGTRGPQTDPKDPKLTLRSTKCSPQGNTESPHGAMRPAHPGTEGRRKGHRSPQGSLPTLGHYAAAPLPRPPRGTLLAVRAKQTKNPTTARKGSAPLRCGRERGRAAPAREAARLGTHRSGSLARCSWASCWPRSASSPGTSAASYSPSTTARCGTSASQRPLIWARGVQGGEEGGAGPPPMPGANGAAGAGRLQVPAPGIVAPGSGASAGKGSRALPVLLHCSVLTSSQPPSPPRRYERTPGCGGWAEPDSSPARGMAPRTCLGTSLGGRNPPRVQKWETRQYRPRLQLEAAAPPLKRRRLANPLEPRVARPGPAPFLLCCTSSSRAARRRFAPLRSH